MKNLRQAYRNALDSGVHTVVYCLRIERLDGRVFRFASHDAPITMQDSGNVYEVDKGSPADSAVRQEAGLDADAFDMEGALLPNGISRADISAGLFDYASLYLFRTLWDDPYEDDEPVVKGFWGQAELKNNRYVTEFKSLSSLMDQNIGRTHSPICSAALGDGDCKVRLDPPVWQASTAYSVRASGEAESGDEIAPSTQNGAWFRCIEAGTSGASEPSWDATPGNTTVDGSVTWEAFRAYRQEGVVAAATTRALFTGQLGFPDDWFGGGTVRFTSGENKDFEREVKAYADDEYTMWKGFPHPIAVGDTFIATAGCRKRFNEDCQSKFDNHVNFQGFPHLPGTNAVNKFGGQ